MAPIHILVVEDEGIVAMDLENSLRSLGYVASAVASSAEEAFHQAAALHPDLVLMDIKLKGEMDGVTAAGEMKKRFGIPVVYLTALGDGETLARAKMTEAYGYLLKPFNERELQIGIEMALSKRAIEDKSKRLERWLATILRSIGDAVIATDTDGSITFMNPVAEGLTGWTQEDAFGRDLTTVLRLVEEGTRAPVENSGFEALRQGVSLVMDKPRILVSKDRTERFIADSAAPIRDENGNVTGAVLVFRDVTERRQADEQLEYLALHDHLTGLPNRAFFMKRLDHAVQSGKQSSGEGFAVVFLDLDRFKSVNDSLGHTVGDQLLVAVGRRLTTCVRPCDTVARLGGDEFGILLADVKDASAARNMAVRIEKALTLPFSLSGHCVVTSACIGIALSSTGDEQAEDLLRDADMAMYHVRSLGRGRHEVFDASLHARALQRTKMEADLRRAIEGHELLVHYQPIVSLSTGKITGAEALVRWAHPERGLVYPEDFIAVAEETALIVPMGEWVLRTAGADRSVWQEPHLEPPYVMVNISAVQFQDEDLVERIRKVLRETRMNTSALQLEITETTAMKDLASSLSTLKELITMGIRISIDDFGTGYSSLGRLRALPIHSLKIDRSFIRDMTADQESRAIVTAIIAMAHALKLKVIAEGVETPDQLRQLRQWACDEVQGNLVSRPLPVESFTHLVRNESCLLHGLTQA